MKTTLVKKRCQRCGAISLVRPRRTRCYQRRFGKGSYCCWGKLTKAEVKMRSKRPKPAAQVAREKLEHAEWMVHTKQRAMKRLVTSIKFWERRAVYYSKRLLAAEAAEATTRTSRGIRLGDAPICD